LALDLFRQRKVKEYIVRQKLGGRQVFRLIAPLYIESACLSCHQYQGYELGTLRGCISIIIPNGEVEGKIISLKYSFITAAVCIILFTVFVLFYMNHLLAIRPLRFLGRWIQRFETDVNYPVPISSRQDEIGDLERSFAQMAVTVRESQLKMEGKIARATAELRETNKELREVNLLLEQQDERKTYFLANVSHDLRTPLTAIRLVVSLLWK